MPQRVEPSIVQRVAGATKRVNSPYTYGAIAYLALNFGLLAAEARWHILARLTAWDIIEIRTLVSMLVKLAHH
jgi:hypothetical protein